MTEFWRRKRGFKKDVVIDKAKERKEVTLMFRAANALLARLGAPDNVYRFLCALIAASGGEVRFEATDAKIGREVFADNRKKETLKMWSRRARNALVRWQHKTGWRVAIISPGGRTGSKNNFSYEPTYYELPLLDAIAEVARAHDIWQAVESFVYELLDEKRGVKRERFENRPRTEGEAMMNRCRKAALTYAEKMCVEALNMQPIATSRAQALANVERLAESFIKEMSHHLRAFSRTGKTRSEYIGREQKKEEVG
jgi:hypothetical protein